MASSGMTRRRALALGALGGLASVLGAPGRALAAPARRRAPRARSFALDVAPADFDGRTSRVLRAPRRFDLLGVRAREAVEVRVRSRGGAWSPWVPLAAPADHAPDTGTGERASDPVWSGGSDELQLRLARAPRRALRVHMVAVTMPPSRRRRGVRARAAQAPPGTPPAIIPRAAWGGDTVAPRGPARYGSVQVAFVHHTVTVNDYAPEQAAGIVLGIAKFHRDVNGWNDLGYNFLVDAYGQVFEGRAGGIDQSVVGAQAQGYNNFSTGIAQLGTYGAVPVGEAAMAATAQLLGWKLPLHGVPTQGTVVVTSAGGGANRFPAGTQVTFERISGHRDADATTCPGDALYAQLPELRARAAGLAGPVVPAQQVTLSAAGGAVVHGEQATFGGYVTVADNPVSGEVVSLQKRDTAGIWVTMAQAIVAPDGTWFASVPWLRAGEVRARTAGGTSPAAAVGLLPHVEARVPASRRVRAGRTFRLSGRVRPAAPMRVVVEVQGRDGAWHRVRAVPATVSGTNWRAAVRLRTPGVYRLTARTAAGDGRAVPIVVRAARRP